MASCHWACGCWQAEGTVSVCANPVFEQHLRLQCCGLTLCFFQVKIVSMNENMALRAALDKNLRSAVTTACLMLPESFSEEDLFIEIAGLSYSGLYSAWWVLHPSLAGSSWHQPHAGQLFVRKLGAWPQLLGHLGCGPAQVFPTS